MSRVPARHVSQTVARARGLALLAAFAATPALAAKHVLVTADGDRLVGCLIAQDGHWIEFDSTLLGRIRVDAKRAHVEQTTTDAGQSAVEAPTHPAETELAESQPGEPSSKSPALAGAATAGATDPLTGRWEHALGFALRLDRGSRETHSDEGELSYEVRRTRGPLRSQLELSYEFDRDEGVVKDNDWNVRLRQDLDLDERHFLAGRFTHQGDMSGGGRKRARALAVAAGWRLLGGERNELRIGPGYVWADLADEAGQARERGPGLYANWHWQHRSGVALSGTTVFVGSLGEDSYWVTDLRLDWPLTPRLGFVWTWDHSRNTYPFNEGESSKLRWLISWKP